jgi:hypothetical protein
MHVWLVVAMLVGMASSAWQRRSLQLRYPSRLREWFRHVTGGILMGLGAAMVPGGNDTLLLGGLPTMTGSALLTYLSLLVGIASGLGILRLARVPMPLISCTPAGCRDVQQLPDNRSQH